jgi:hypothetical protein
MPGVRWMLMVVGLGLMTASAVAQVSPAVPPAAPAEAPTKAAKKPKRSQHPSAAASTAPVRSKPAAQSKSTGAAVPAAPEASAPKVSLKKPNQPPAQDGAHGSPAPPAAAAPGAPTTGAPATKPATKPVATAAAAAAKASGPKCAIEEPEQPRGGRLDVSGSGFGQAPVVRIAGRPVRMLERREDLLSVQVPADSNGGPVSVQAQGVTEPCGALVIIGKNR